MNRARAACGVALLVALAGCRRKPEPPPVEDELPRVAAPRVLVAGPRPPIRDVSAASKEQGRAVAMARLMISKITTADALPIAIRLFALVEGQPEGAGSVDHEASSRSLKVIVKPPEGPEIVLEPAQAVWMGRQPSGMTQRLAIGQRGFAVGNKLIAYKTPAPALFSVPGRHEVRISGTSVGEGQKRDFSTPALSFEVEAESPSRLSISALEAKAAEVAARENHGRGGPTRPKPRHGGREPPVVVSMVDDVTDQRWARVRVDDGDDDSDNHIIDVLLTGEGRLVAAQDHYFSTCVAEGTLVSTPGGPTPIERLLPGDQVDAYDVERQRPAVATIEQRGESVASGLVRLGGATLTAGHPVWMNGAFQPAGAVTAGASLLGPGGAQVVPQAPRAIGGAARVFDITVGYPHTFFAGGVLVHNKIGHAPLAPGDGWAGLFTVATDGR